MSWSIWCFVTFDVHILVFFYFCGFLNSAVFDVCGFGFFAVFDVFLGNHWCFAGFDVYVHWCFADFDDYGVWYLAAFGGSFFWCLLVAVSFVGGKTLKAANINNCRISKAVKIKSTKIWTSKATKHPKLQDTNYRNIFKDAKYLKPLLTSKTPKSNKQKL